MEFRTNKKGKPYPVTNGEQKPYAEMTETERTIYDNKQRHLRTQEYLKNHSWQPKEKPEREEHYCRLCDKRLQEWRYNKGNIPDLCGACSKNKGKVKDYEEKKELQLNSVMLNPSKEREQLRDKKYMEMSDKEKEYELFRMRNG